MAAETQRTQSERGVYVQSAAGGLCEVLPTYVGIEGRLGTFEVRR